MVVSESKPDSNWPAFAKACRCIFDDTQYFDDYARRFSFGTDASFYRLTPKLVVKVGTEIQLTLLLDVARRFNVPLTFRAAGTSLSGQAVTASVLVMLERHWNGIMVLKDGNQISLQAGVVGVDANAALAPYKRKIGPDPASLNTCKIGGIVANNASGMCCGVARNSYHTLAAIRLMLVDGTVMDTRDPNSVAKFRRLQHWLLSQLELLGVTTRNNSSLVEKIRHKYRLKNTTGYSLNALVDYDDPIDILTHLMIGSEGTLGFISEVTFDTVPDYAHRALALVFFCDMDQCCLAVS